MKKRIFCPGCQTRDKRAPPFVSEWRSRLENWDNKGFPTGTNQCFCSSDSLKRTNGEKDRLSAVALGAFFGVGVLYNQMVLSKYFG